MNKKLQFKSVILLVALLLGGVGSAWAEDETLQFKGTSTTNMTGGNDAALVGLNANDWSVIGDKGSNTNYPGLNKAGNIRLYYHKNGSNIITVSSLNNSTINSITVNYGSETNNKKTTHYNGGVVKVGGSTINDTNDDDDIGQYTINSTSFSIENGNNSNVQVWITSIVINYTLSAGSVATPTFSPAEGVYSSAQSVTLACTTQGATIYYTEGDEPADPTSGSTQYTGAIAVNATTTIKAIAIKGTKTSSVASATYTILDKKSISEVRALGTGNVFTQGVVTSCVGTTGYIQDANAAICVYGASLTVGDDIKVQGTLTTYKGLLEITNPIITVVSNNNTINPVIKTIEEINSDDYTADNTLQGILVKIENATVTKIEDSNTTIAQGGNTIVVRNIPSGIEYAVNDKLTLEGNIGCFDGAQIANPTNIVVTKNVKPAISADDVTIEFDATSGEIAYTIEKPTSATLTATITPGIAWISNIGYETGKVTFTTEANDGAERTAIITLSYSGAEDKVVKITQKECGSASVPFAFDGGRDDITTTYGLTQEGLGTDYGSNAPKLKFDTGDDKSKDNLILRINDAAKVLSFDIKGNSFSGSTFDVLTSADGETYTQLASYTELPSTVLHESFILNNDVRYIKWIYTNKNNGNVGLGNIKVFSNESVAIPVSKYTTFVSTANIDFSGTGVTAYTAEVNGNAAKLSAISGNIVPANTGVILYAETAGNYVGTITEGDPTGAPVSVDGNELVGVTTETAVPWTANSKYNYILQDGVFKKATGAKLHAGKAYLSTTNPPASRELQIVFEDEATGIADVKSQKEEGGFFNLSGQRVTKPTKGLYINNGKKMIVK